MNKASTPGAGVIRRFLFSLFAVMASVAFAQPATDNGSISGRVVSALDGTPLAGALVSLPDLGLETSTDRFGQYTFLRVPSGTHTLRLSYLGLPPQTLTVAVTAGERVDVSPRLGDAVITLETFNVSGQRAGQALALNQQRASDNLRNIISADALGRFPDQNAAETLQRVPGLSLERDQGEGRFVVVRGIDPDLNNTLMNGISIPAAESDTRKVNLDVVPSDLLESVEVVKAVTPDMDADAIGGSVNLKTLTAFSHEGRILRGSAEGQYSDLSGEWGHRVSFTWGDIFSDGRFGTTWSLSDQKRTFGSDNREYGDPWDEVDGFIVPGGDVEHREYFVIRKRQGLSASLDLRLSEDDEFYVRGVYNHFADYENRFLTGFGGDPDETEPSGDRVGTITEGGVEVTLKDRWEDNNILTLSTGGEHRRGAATVDYVVSYAKAELLDDDGIDAVFASDDTTWSYDLTDPAHPRFTGPGASLDASEFFFDEYVVAGTVAEEREWAVAANLRVDRDFGGNRGFWKVGAKFRAKEKDADINEDIYEDASDGEFTLDPVARYSDSGRSLSPTFPSIDPGLLASFIRDNPGVLELSEDDSILESTLGDYVTQEDVFAAYAMASVTLNRLTILGGVRMELTQFETTGWEVVDEDIETLAPISADRDYTNVLPNLHLRYDFTERLVARASWTQTLARPKFPDSAYSRVIDDEGDYSQGNPELDPYFSNNYDVSLEYYPESLGVLSVGVFRKDIDDFIFRQRLAGASPAGTDLVIPLNGETARIDGAELAWQQQFTMLPAPFDALGVYVNFTFTNSETDLGAARSGENLPLLKQSDRISNLALSWEKHGFFIRLAYNYRSDYFEEVGEEADEDLYVDSRYQVDLSTNYRINDRFTIYAEFLNLTDEPFVVSWGGRGGPAQLEFYSWSANAGVKFNF